MIHSLRKKQGMTQTDLARNMHVTDKAVSKWERNLSCPDISSIPKLVEILDTTVDALLNVQPIKKIRPLDTLIDIVLIGVGLAVGICIVVTSILEQMHMNDAITMLGIGMSCLAVYLLKNRG